VSIFAREIVTVAGRNIALEQEEARVQNRETMGGYAVARGQKKSILEYVFLAWQRVKSLAWLQHVNWSDLLEVTRKLIFYQRARP